MEKVKVYTLTTALVASLGLNAVQGFPTNEARAGVIEQKIVCTRNTSNAESRYINVAPQDIATTQFKDVAKIGLDNLNAIYEPVSAWVLADAYRLEYVRGEGLMVCVRDSFLTTPGGPSE